MKDMYPVIFFAAFVDPRMSATLAADLIEEVNPDVQQRSLKTRIALKVLNFVRYTDEEVDAKIEELDRLRQD